MKTATIIGCTGLIGGHLLQLLLNDSYYIHVRILVRRPLAVKHPKLQMRVVDFSDQILLKDALLGSDAVFIAVGTTQKKVKGDMTAYRKVDFDIPVNTARFCKELSCSHFSLVSSVGADSQSGNFYLKLKGEVEEELKKLNLPSVSVFRPSMLLGKRVEFRLGERIGQGFMRALSFLIPSKYKPVQAELVAKAMLAASKNSAQGFHVYHYGEMKKLAL